MSEAVIFKCTKTKLTLNGKHEVDCDLKLYACSLWSIAALPHGYHFRAGYDFILYNRQYIGYLNQYNYNVDVSGREARRPDQRWRHLSLLRWWKTTTLGT